MLKVGDKAPKFSLPDQDGNMHSLKEFAGKWLLLYFYPKDSTPGCTVEACSLRDSDPAYQKAGIAVLGASADSEQSHAKFAAKYKLPFPLLADVDKTLIKDYGVWGEKKMMGRKYMGIRRWSFLIDPKGKVAKIYEGVKPGEHAQEVLGDVAGMKKK